MRTIPPINHDVFTDPRQREVIKVIADALRQVNGGMARSVLPGQAPPANPVPSSVTSRPGVAASSVLSTDSREPLWADPSDPSSPVLVGFVKTAGISSGPQTITTPNAGHGVLKLQRCPAPSSGAVILQITDEVGTPIAEVFEDGTWAGPVNAAFYTAILPTGVRLDNGSGAVAAVLDCSGITTDRAVVVQDKAGTIALLSDCGGAIEGTADLTGQTASITTTNLVSSTSAAGMYRVTAYVKVTTAGGAADTLQTTIGWNDGSAQAQYVMMDFDQLSGAPTTALNLGTNNHPFTGAIDVYATSASAITYATTLTAAGSPAYTLRLRAQRIG